MATVAQGEEIAQGQACTGSDPTCAKLKGQKLVDQLSPFLRLTRHFFPEVLIFYFVNLWFFCVPPLITCTNQQKWESIGSIWEYVNSSKSKDCLRKLRGRETLFLDPDSIGRNQGPLVFFWPRGLDLGFCMEFSQETLRWLAGRHGWFDGHLLIKRPTDTPQLMENHDAMIQDHLQTGDWEPKPGCLQATVIHSARRAKNWRTSGARGWGRLYRNMGFTMQRTTNKFAQGKRNDSPARTGF